MPARELEGLKTASGWTIGAMISASSGSGGNFCTRYTAISANGTIGFLKAMDLSQVAAKPLEVMYKTIAEYLFEQDILEHCKNKRLTRVVVPLDSGEILSPGAIAPLNRVFYIIFEMADADLREQFINKEVGSWKGLFASLHHIAVGIKQLHQAGIAHQDLKPSNILYFEKKGTKISDLGRVTDDKGVSPFSDQAFTGDRAYAPIEIHFEVFPKEFIDRRLSDFYMFGSLIFQIISGEKLTPVLIGETRLLMPNVDNTSYCGALPFIKSAFGTIMGRFQRECEDLFGVEVAQELTGLVRELCYPDYDHRGNCKHKDKVQRLSMEKYISKMASVKRLAHIGGVS